MNVAKTFKLRNGQCGGDAPCMQDCFECLWTLKCLRMVG